MSANIETVDRETQTIWLTFYGRGDRLFDEIGGQGIAWLPSLHNGCIGIPYSMPSSSNLFNDFCRAARFVVEYLVERVPDTRPQALSAYYMAVVQVQLGQSGDMRRSA